MSVTATPGIARNAETLLLADLERECFLPGGGPDETLVPHLRPALGDDRALEWLAAAAATASSPQARLAALRELAAAQRGVDDRPEERAAVLDVLGWTSATDGQVAAFLAIAPPSARMAVSAWARASGRGAPEAALVRQLASEAQPAWLQRSFIRTLGIVGSEQGLMALPPFLRSPDAATARAALGAVVAIGSPIGAGILGKLLYDRSSQVRGDVARALYLLAPEKGLAAIAGLAADADPAARKIALGLVRDLLPGQGGALLVSRLFAEEDEELAREIGALLAAYPAQEVLAPASFGASRGTQPTTDVCLGLLERIVASGAATKQQAASAGKDYVPPPPLPTYAWSQTVDAPATPRLETQPTVDLGPLVPADRAAPAWTRSWAARLVFLALAVRLLTALWSPAGPPGAKAAPPAPIARPGLSR